MNITDIIDKHEPLAWIDVEKLKPNGLAYAHTQQEAESEIPLYTRATVEKMFREVQQWLPIETAPKDGTMILLGRATIEDCAPISVPGFWQDGCEDGVDYMGGDSGFVDVNFQQFHGGRSFGAEHSRYAANQPTHWMPLPAAPSPAKEQS